MSAPADPARGAALHTAPRTANGTAPQTGRATAPGAANGTAPQTERATAPGAAGGTAAETAEAAGGLVGILLAAGGGRRMGRPKALVVGDDGEPWLVRGVRVLREGGCEHVVVVLG